MTDSTGNHDLDLVRYSLLSDQDQQDEELLGGTDRDDESRSSPRNMARISFAPAKGFLGRLRGSQRIMFLALLCTIFLIMIWLLSHMDIASLPNPVPVQKDKVGSSMTISFEAALRPDGSTKADDLRTDMDSSAIYSRFEEVCYKTGKLGRSISDVHKKIIILKNAIKEECHLMWQIFDAMFRIEAIGASITLPKTFQAEVKDWLNHDDQLFEQVNNQVIYKVANKGTFEETVFNPVRSKRPQSKSTVDPISYIKNLTESTRPNCDFCQYKEHTAEDSFGRIDNEYSASCSNTFKLAKFHALFFPKQHSPLNLTLDHIEDLYLRTSRQWFKKAYETDTKQTYPSLMFDLLPHAGASQVHPHIHGVLDEYQYVGGFESWHQLSLQYYAKFKRSFWSDFVQLHFALGLGISSGEAMVIVPISARKDHEFMILSPTLNRDVTALIYKVLQTYQNKLGVYCFSSGGVYPRMIAGVNGDKGMPVILRFGSRGTCTSIGSDVSSLELYTINNINSDLAKTYSGLVES